MKPANPDTSNFSPENSSPRSQLRRPNNDVKMPVDETHSSVNLNPEEYDHYRYPASMQHAIHHQQASQFE